MANNNKIELLFKYVNSMGYNVKVLEGPTYAPLPNECGYRKKQAQEFEKMQQIQITSDDCALLDQHAIADMDHDHDALLK